jgi:hypothetical protein
MLRRVALLLVAVNLVWLFGCGGGGKGGWDPGPPGPLEPRPVGGDNDWAKNLASAGAGV